MAESYDSDLVALGWDPIALLRRWPLIVPPGSVVLDIGCGTGAVLEAFAGADRTLVGLDASTGMLAEARKRKALRSAPLYAQPADQPWPIYDGTIDVAISLAMLEFVPNLDVALDELARVLRVGGAALLTTEDVVDWDGVPRELVEQRYDLFPLWRRTREEFELCLPPALDLVRYERIRGYTVLESGFTCAYHCVEVVRNDRC